MRPLKNFEDFIKIGIIKKQSPNKLRAKDLFEASDRKFNNLNKILEKIGLSNENANDIIEYCYDIIISLLRGEMLLKGYSSSGFGAHEAEVSFLRLLEFSETDADFINKLRYFRNGIMYYGKIFDKEYAEKILEFMNKIRKKLKSKKQCATNSQK